MAFVMRTVLGLHRTQHTQSFTTTLVEAEDFEQLTETCLVTMSYRQVVSGFDWV